MFTPLYQIPRQLPPGRLPFHGKPSLKHVNMSATNPSPLTEARELLNEWLVKCVYSEDEFDAEAYGYEPEVHIPSRLEIKKEWDHLLKRAEEISENIGTKPTALSELNYLTEKRSTSANGNMTRRVESSSRNVKIHKEDVSEKQAPTGDILHRILVRQGEARIRRVMRRGERERQRQDTLVKREAEREALAIVKQEETERRRQLKREEELIQSEMVRIRKEMEIEKERMARSKLKEIQLPKEMSEVIPALEQARECPKLTASSTLLSTNLENWSLSCTKQFTVEENTLLRQHFLNWRQTVVATRIQVATFAERRHCRLKRSAFRSWRSWSVEARLERELEKAKEFARELERKETAAVDLYETRLKHQIFETWHANAIRHRLERINAGRKRVREELETGFLERLREFTATPVVEVCATEEKPLPYKSAIISRKEIRSSKASVDRAISNRNSYDLMESVVQCTNFGTNHFCCWVKPSKISARSAVERPSLAQTVLQQRQRIAAQNRQIEELKSAQRYTELMLEAKAHAMVDQLLQKASENATQASSSKSVRSPVDSIHICHPRSYSAREANSTSHFEPTSNEDRYQENPWSTQLPLDAINTNKSAFLRRMEEHALRRARSRLEREERRRLAENRKKEEMAKRLEEEERQLAAQKRAVLEAQKAKKRAEEEKLRRQEARLAMQQELDVIAQKHSNLRCLRYCGWSPWRRYILKVHEQLRKAREHREHRLVEGLLITWFNYVKQREMQVTMLVRRAFHHILLKRYFSSWRIVFQEHQIALGLARTWYDRKLVSRLLSAWFRHVNELRCWELLQTDLVLSHSHHSLKRKTFEAWLRFPDLMKKERMRECRRERLRGRLRDLIPDFNPPETSKRVTVSSLRLQEQSAL